MNKPIAVIGNQSGQATSLAATLVAVALRDTSKRSDEPKGVDPFTEHANYQPSRRILDPLSFEMIPDDQKLLQIVDRRPDGAQDTKDA